MLSLLYGRYNVYENGDVFDTQNNKKVKPVFRGKGYLNVRMYKDGNRLNHSLHRLIAMSFIPNPEKKPQVNHKNGIKTDNRLENLEWCTISENIKHCYANGMNPTMKVNSEDIKNIRIKYKEGYTQKILADIFGIGQGQISRIINYKRSYE